MRNFEMHGYGKVVLFAVGKLQVFPFEKGHISSFFSFLFFRVYCIYFLVIGCEALSYKNVIDP